jgi:hypothetical protein
MIAVFLYKTILAICNTPHHTEVEGIAGLHPHLLSFLASSLINPLLLSKHIIRNKGTTVLFYV